MIRLEIPGVDPERYRAGEDGQLWSRIGRRKVDRGKWLPVRGWKTHNGYYVATLYLANGRITRSVHRMICAAFHGLPELDAVVRHLDGVATNNVPSNLCWGTDVENWTDRKVHGRGSMGAGEDNPAAKISDIDRAGIQWALDLGLCTQAAIAMALNVSPGAVSCVANRRRYRFVSLPVDELFEVIS